MASYRNRNGKWQAQVRLKGHAPQVKSFVSKRDAEKWARYTEAELEASVFRVDTRILDRTLVRDLLDDSPAPEKAPPAKAPIAPAEPVSGAKSAVADEAVVVSKPDPSETPDPPELEPEPEMLIVFTPAQLDAYGASELNTLADLLYADGPGLDEKFAAVANAISKKIDHDRVAGDEALSDKAFLEAYYRAARAKMETDAQWGRLRQNKFDRDRGRKPSSDKLDDE